MIQSRYSLDASARSGQDLLPWPSENPGKGARFGPPGTSLAPPPCREGAGPRPLLVSFGICFGFFFLSGGFFPFHLFVFGFLECLFLPPGQSVSSSNNKNLEAKFSQYFSFFFQSPDKNLEHDYEKNKELL